MPELLFVHDPARVSRTEAIQQARALGIPIVVHGLAPWMQDRGDIAFGKDGTVVVALSSVPRRNANREVLALFRDGDKTPERLAALTEFPPDPPPAPPPLDVLRADIATLKARVAGLESQRAGGFTRGDRLVIASYFPWYGTPDGPTGQWAHWYGDQGQRQPLWANTPPSLYDSRDPAVIQQHGQAARAAGIDAFMVSWWGQNEPENVTLPIVLNNCPIPCALQLETAGLADKGYTLQAQVIYALQQYGSHPNLLRIDGRPVVFVYNPPDVAAWADILAHPAVQAHNPLVLADHVSEAAAQLFDGVLYWGPAADYQAGKLAANYAWGRSVAATHGKLWCATVFPGYDDAVVRPPGTARVPRDSGATLAATWAIATGSSPDLIHVMSWNEWHEGSELEGWPDYQAQNAALAAGWKGQAALVRHLPPRSNSAAGAGG